MERVSTSVVHDVISRDFLVLFIHIYFLRKSSRTLRSYDFILKMPMMIIENTDESQLIALNIRSLVIKVLVRGLYNRNLKNER